MGGLASFSPSKVFIAANKRDRSIATAEVFIDVENEDEIFVLKIAAYRRMVPTTGAENALASEIDDVAPPRIIR
jgi:hypothetical protein